MKFQACTNCLLFVHQCAEFVLSVNSIYYQSAYYISKISITNMFQAKFLKERLNSNRLLDNHSKYNSAKPLEFNILYCINFYCCSQADLQELKNSV